MGGGQRKREKGKRERRTETHTNTPPHGEIKKRETDEKRE